MKKPSKAKQAKIDFLASLPSLGWTQPADRFGHYKMNVVVTGSDPVRTKTVRLKISTLSWRLEREVTIEASRLGKESKAWVCIRWGYFTDTEAPSPKVPSFSVKPKA